MKADPALLGGSLEIDGMGMGWASAVSSDGSAPPVPDFDASVMPTGGPNVAWGSVVGAATSVEVRPDGADAIDVPLLAAPAVTGIDRQYFLTDLPKLESDTGTIVALGAAGAVVGQQDYDLTGGNTSPGYPGDCPLPEPAPTTEPGGDGQITGGCVMPAPPVCATTSAGGAAEECPPPLPGTCPPVEAGGDKNSVKECIVCSDISGPDGTTSNTATNDCPPLPVCTGEPASDPTTSGPSGGGCVFFPPCPETTSPEGANGAGCADTPVACATSSDGQTVECDGGGSSSGGISDPSTGVAVPVGSCPSDDTGCLQGQPEAQATTGR